MSFSFKNVWEYGRIRPFLTKTRVACSVMLATTALLFACSEDPETNPDEGEPDPPDSEQTDSTSTSKPIEIEYMEFNTASAVDLNVSQQEDGSYRITTTGTDPYISTKPLKTKNPSDSVVLTFEYKTNSSIESFQIFFATPVSEERSIKIAKLESARAQWKTFSINLKTQIDQFSWGKVDDYLRLDFGQKSGVTIQIQKMYLRAMNDEEKEEQESEQDKAQYEAELSTNLQKYLQASYRSEVTSVEVKPFVIDIKGNCVGDGEFSLCEVPPYLDVTQITNFEYRTPITSSSFSLSLSRTAERDGIEYDRALSKWVIVKTEDGKETIDSHAHYADDIQASQSMSPMQLTTKKGLGGFHLNAVESDLDDLGIGSVTVNVPITAYMFTSDRGNCISHTYGGITYYFDRGGIENLDATFRATTKRNIVVSAILLIQPAASCPDPEIGRLLQHPDYTSQGIYTMPNMTNPESVNCYAAALDFLASRYCRADNQYGRINYWIMHNEVDMGLDWTNMGAKSIWLYTDTYMKSMRMCYNIARQYDPNAEVLGSFTHHWAQSSGANHPSKDMLEMIVKYSKLEGDFKWGVAHHPYPDDLSEPKTWLDKNATFSMSSPKVTFKNLEVINKWILESENLYMGTTKRTLWLSENGTNSPTYSEEDLNEQAAGFAYAWKKIKALDGIDGIQWHNWIDNRSEYGLRIGLRRYPDDEEDPLGKKHVWYAYQAAGTDQEDTVFEPYLAIIGISDWDIVQDFISE